MSNDQKKYYFNEKIEKAWLQTLTKKRSTKICLYRPTTKNQETTPVITFGTK